MEEIGITVIEKEDVVGDQRHTGHITAPSPDDFDVDDLYTKYKKLQRQLEFLEVQEEYIKDEQKNLKKRISTCSRRSETNSKCSISHWSIS